jgi:hypothetical protein
MFYSTIPNHLLREKVLQPSPPCSLGLSPIPCKNKFVKKPGKVEAVLKKTMFKTSQNKWKSDIRRPKCKEKITSKKLAGKNSQMKLSR